MLATKHEVSTGDLVDITRQACLAFDHAWSHKFLHKNLRPANVMVEWDGSVKIMDFGVPKPTPAELARTIALPDLYHYLSPEEISGGATDIRSSVFTWGVMLYELVTGKKPFTGANVAELSRNILEHKPAPPNQLQPMLPAGINYVITKALAKAPGERYQTG